MNKKILEIFRNISKSDNCCENASSLARELSQIGYKPIIRRVAHKSNIFGDNPFLSCQHVCGEDYSQHFVVEVENNILDFKLGIPVSLLEYLEKTYLNFNDLRMS